MLYSFSIRTHFYSWFYSEWNWMKVILQNTAQILCWDSLLLPAQHLWKKSHYWSNNILTWSDSANPDTFAYRQLICWSWNLSEWCWFVNSYLFALPALFVPLTCRLLNETENFLSFLEFSHCWVVAEYVYLWMLNKSCIKATFIWQKSSWMKYILPKSR